MQFDLPTLCVVLGIIMLLLASFRNIWTFVVGILQVALMSYVNFLNYEYYQTFLHIVFFLPMQFYGFWRWYDMGARLSGHTQLRHVRCMTFFRLGHTIGYSLLLFAVVWPLVYGVYLLLFNVGELQEIVMLTVFLDTLLIVCNVVGQILMSLGYKEQWYYWIVVNVVALAISVHSLLDQEVGSYDLSKLFMNTLYFLNSILGLYLWAKDAEVSLPVSHSDE